MLKFRTNFTNVRTLHARFLYHPHILNTFSQVGRYNQISSKTTDNSNYYRKKNSDRYGNVDLLSWPAIAFLILATTVTFSSQAEAKKSDLALNTVNTDKLTDHIYEGWKNLKTAKEKKVVLMVGNSNCGKSTLVNYLIGNPLEYIKKGGNLGYYRVDNKHPGPDISKHQAMSETLYPAVYHNPDDGEDAIHYFDLPGLQDSRSDAEKAWTQVARDLAVKVCKEVSSVIIVISQDDLGNNCEGFKKLIRSLSEILLFDGDSNFNAKNFQIVFTKSNDKEKSVDDVKELLKDVKNCFERESKDFTDTLNLVGVDKILLTDGSWNFNIRSEGDKNNLRMNIIKSDKKLNELLQKSMNLNHDIKILEALFENANIIVQKDYIDNSTTKDAIIKALQSVTEPLDKERLRFVKPQQTARLHFENLLDEIYTDSKTTLDSHRSIFNKLKDIQKELTEIKQITAAFDQNSSKKKI
jgi:GTPase SAR1 family protein